MDGIQWSHFKSAYPNLLNIYILILPLNFLPVQTVPSCQNLYKNSFTYHCLPDDKTLPFDEAIQFLGMFLFVHLKFMSNIICLHAALICIYNFYIYLSNMIPTQAIGTWSKLSALWTIFIVFAICYVYESPFSALSTDHYTSKVYFLFYMHPFTNFFLLKVYFRLFLIVNRESYGLWYVLIHDLKNRPFDSQFDNHVLKDDFCSILNIVTQCLSIDEFVVILVIFCGFSLSP